MPVPFRAGSKHLGGGGIEAGQARKAAAPPFGSSERVGGSNVKRVQAGERQQESGRLELRERLRRVGIERGQPVEEEHADMRFFEPGGQHPGRFRVER
ncbi:MAG: hypothetical protein ACK55I_37995, partial [bacterium]